MAIDVASILKRRREEVDFPKPLPAGVYYGRITGLPKRSDEKTDKTGKEFVMMNFPIQLDGYGQGVDPDLLQASGGLTNKDGSPKRVDHGIYLTNDNQHRLWLFLDSFHGKGNYEDLLKGFEALVGRRVQVVLEIFRRDENDPDSDWHRTAACLPFEG